MQRTFERMFPEEKSIEKVTNKISATKDCSKSNERVALNQALKNQLVVELIKVSTAKGVIKINTFTITYLKEYVKSRFIKLIVIKLFNTPSSEKTFMLVVLSLVIILSNLRISWEKLILHPKMFSPNSRIARDISEFIFKNCSIKKYDELDKIANINNLNINWNGCSVYVFV